MAYDKELTTPAEMYEFSEKNGFGSGWGRRWGLKNGKWIKRHLEEGEKVYFTFVGLHRFYSMSQHKRNFFYAITDRRILMGQVRIFDLTRFEAKPLSSLQTLAVNDSDSIGVVTFIFEDENVPVGVAQETATNLKTALADCYPLTEEWKRRAAAGAVPVEPEAQSDASAGE